MSMEDIASLTASRVTTVAIRRRGISRGSGTATNFAINAFQSAVERRRARDRPNRKDESPELHPYAIGRRRMSLQARTSATTMVSMSPDRGNAPDTNDIVQSMINASAGSYAWDDGASDIADRYNFYAHGRRFLFATCSLGYFDESSEFRQRIIWFITSREFDRLVLAMIVANSIVLAIPDLSKMTPEGELDSTNSLRNTVFNNADLIFTSLFFVECMLKIIAMGLFGEKGAYLMDPWNWIDFLVVTVGIVAALPGISSVDGFSAVRMLRPLRILNAVSGIKKLVAALLQSIPELLTVVAFLLFLFFFYGVIGVQLWSGALHARCRLTPLPVQMDPNMTWNATQFQQYQLNVVNMYTDLDLACKDEHGKNIDVDNSSWSHDTSPWVRPRICYWPVADEDNPQTCALDGLGYRQCPQNQTCGSDFDSYGNFRFTHPNSAIVKYVLETTTFQDNMNFGLTTFDNIGRASMNLFIVLPREGWSDIMYMLQDAGYEVGSVLYFVSFVLIASYFVLNLTLAVIWDNFTDASLREATQSQQKQKQSILPQIKRVNLESRIMPTNHMSTARRIVIRVVNSTAFNVARTSLILLNTIILSLDQYPIDYELNYIIEVINFSLTLAFLVEMVLKIISFGWRQYLQDRYNVFDALVVIVGIAELSIAPPQFLTGVASTDKSRAQAFSGLRSLRIFALFKLTRSWTSLQKLLSTIAASIKELGNFGILLMLFMYVYALVGMQAFGNRFRFDAYGYQVPLGAAASYIPRANFDTILWSMVTIFQILTGENWNSVMMDAWRATGWMGALYFVSLVIFGQFILLNLFLAIMLGNFEDSTGVEAMNELKDELRRRSRVIPVRMEGAAALNAARPSNPNMKVAAVSDSASRKKSSMLRQKPMTARAQKLTGGGSAPLPPPPLKRRLSLSQRSSSNLFAEKPPPKHPLTGRALFVFSTNSAVRKFVHQFVTHPRFDSAMMVLVACSTISVALDNPLEDPEGLRMRILFFLDLITSSLFLIEVLLKLIAFGVWFDPNAYLRDGWNVLDFVLTATAMPGLAGSSQSKALSAIKSFRALRPLRMITRNPGLKLVVSSLIASVPQIINVMMVCLLVFTVFSIVAVNNLKGKLYSCQGDVFDSLSQAQQDLITYPRPWANLTVEEQSWFQDNQSALAYKNMTVSDGGILTSRLLCGWLGATWDRTIPQSFDNVLLGVLSLYEISTTEGWVTVMLAGVDARDIDMQPVPNAHEGWTIFFITYICMGSFFVIQLFIGVVIENFNRMKDKLDGTFVLTFSQREWLLISQAMLNLKPVRKMKTPRSKIRRTCFRLAQSPTLESGIMGCIILNTIMMALTYFGEDDLFRQATDYCNYAFALIFTFESAVKIIGLGRYYWKDSWNIFDFSIVVGSFFGMLYVWGGGSASGANSASIRSLRVARLIRLVQSAPSLRQLTNTLWITLPSLVNIGGLLSLVFFIYAGLGVQLFAKVKMGDLVTPTTNFQTISRAMTTLIRCATGERWNDLMHELSSHNDCKADLSYQSDMCGFNNAPDCKPLTGCGTTVAFAYFCSFTLLVTFILLNIFIAVILEGFADEKDRANSVLLPQHYENFVNVWAMLDPEATGFIEWHQFPRLLQLLDEPLGFGRNQPSLDEMRLFMDHLDLSIYNGNKVFFSDAVRKLAKFVLDVVNGGIVDDLPPTITTDQKWRTWLRGSKIRKMERCSHRLNHIHAAVLLHDSVKSLLFREELHTRVAKFKRLTADLFRRTGDVSSAAQIGVSAFDLAGASDAKGDDDEDELMWMLSM
ncbi:TPA: hypothetical protein N0F65_012614 [Lagenidium giganteum]|uniref:EF-hand domain-containing protein n=1 Tax=Lagenidium giganteum TaxID=4803 RepID=A0AAV2YRG8_9STRA|nr:TPA: hypothetical protein N0F65_012614 [Lagenidium giganteum]